MLIYTYELFLMYIWDSKTDIRSTLNLLGLGIILACCLLTMSGRRSDSVCCYQYLLPMIYQVGDNFMQHFLFSPSGSCLCTNLLQLFSTVDRCDKSLQV